MSVTLKAPDLLSKFSQLKNQTGATPVFQIPTVSSNTIFTKLEFLNKYGSIKDRPALRMVEKAIEIGEVTEETTLIESTSGNLGISLSQISNALHIPFIPVIDKSTSIQKEQKLRFLNKEVIKITEKDDTGNYLKNRIKTVENFLLEHSNSHNLNQYKNKNNYLSYYYSLGQEIIDSAIKPDFVFIPVSSCGTVTGLSMRLKEYDKNIQIIAVDVEGSVIFQNDPKSRVIPGIGASIKPEIVKNAIIDDIIFLNSLEVISGCHQLFKNHQVFAGGSSGAAYQGILKYIEQHNLKNKTILFMCPDQGADYLDTIYNLDWTEKLKNSK